MRRWRVVIGTPAVAGAPHGYGIIAGGITRTLGRDPRFDVLPALLAREWDIRLLVSVVSPWMLAGCDASDVIWHTMFEVEPFPAWWADILNGVRGVWVPSTWVKDQLRSIGVRVPILVAPYGIDHGIFTYVDRRETRKDKPFTVFAWGRGFVSRKRLLDAVAAFVKADIPNSRLVVKVNEDDETVRNGASFTWNGQEVENVTVIRANMGRRAIAQLLHEADVMLYLSGGEGLGLMPLEAMATGLPVILMPVTGMTEYANEHTAFLVAGRREYATTYMARWHYESWWWRADLDDVADVLRYAYAHPSERHRIGDAGHRKSLEFTWSRMADSLAAFLDQITEG